MEEITDLSLSTLGKLMNSRFPLVDKLNIDNIIRTYRLGPSINGLVTDGNTAKLCCRGFILALFQSTTANKVYSEHTGDCKRLLPVCEAEILRVTVKIIEVLSSFMLIFDDFRLKVPKIAKKGT